MVPWSLCFGSMVTYPDYTQFCSSLYQEAKEMERSELKSHPFPRAFLSFIAVAIIKNS